MILLEPIERATRLLSASNYATHGDIRSVFLGIQEYLIQHMNDNDFSQHAMAQLIYKKLADYWPILDESSQIFSLLDPRVKLSAFKDDNEINRAKNSILGLSGYSLTSESTSASTSTSTITSINDVINTRNYFRQLRGSSNNTSTINSPTVYNIQGELDRYLAISLDDQMDPLIWWQVQQQGFPILSQVARDYLCIQVTSVASEQAFSITGQTISSLRNRLEAETARATLCLKSWFRQKICVK
jgi:hypothetical protein